MKPDTGIIFGSLSIFVGCLWLFLYSPSLQHLIISWNESAPGSELILGKYVPPISILDLLGSALCARFYRINITSRKSWFETLLSCLLLQFGGTVVTGLILGQVPAWMMGYSAITGFLVAWWLTFFSPNDLYWKVLHSNPVLPFLLGLVGGVVSCGHGTSTWGVDFVLNNSFHTNAADIRKSWVAAILCGTFTICGGGIMCEVLGFTKVNSYTMTSTPAYFKIGDFSATRELNTSFLLAILYYILVNTDNFLHLDVRMSIPMAHAVMLICRTYLYCLHEMWPHIDILQNVSNTILKMLAITPYVDFSLSKEE